MDRVVPRLGELACGQRAELGDPRLDLVQRIGVAPSRQLDRGRRGGQARLAGGLDRREHLRGRRGDRRSQLVPTGVRVARCLPVPEPVVPAGDIAAAPREKEALRAGARPFDGLAQRAGEVGVPEQRVAAHQRGVAGEADDDRERGPVGTVDRDHADRVVHRPLGDDPVDGDPRCAAGPEADACGCQRARGGVDDAGDRLRQELGVAGEAGRIAQPDDAAPTGEARRAVVVARVDENGLRRDAGQGRDALAHRGRQIGTGEDEVHRDDRERVAPSSMTSACATSGSWTPSARPVRRAQQPCGRPHGGVMSARATPALSSVTGCPSFLSRSDRQLLVGLGSTLSQRERRALPHAPERSGSRSATTRARSTPGSVRAIIAPSGAST